MSTFYVFFKRSRIKTGENMENLVMKMTPKNAIFEKNIGDMLWQENV